MFPYYFLLSQAITYQYFNLKNYFTVYLLLGTVSQTILTIQLLCLEIIHIQTYIPSRGSNFSISGKFLPYSLFNKVDYSALGNQAEFQTVNAQGQRIQIKVKLIKKNINFGIL